MKQPFQVSCYLPEVLHWKLNKITGTTFSLFFQSFQLGGLMIIRLMALAIINSLLLKLIFYGMKRAEQQYWKWWKPTHSWSFSLVDLHALKRKKTHFLEQEILSTTRKIWSKVGWPQWGSDSVTAPNKQKIPDLFPETSLVLKGSFFPGGIITFFVVGLVLFLPRKMEAFQNMLRWF